MARCNAIRGGRRSYQSDVLTFYGRAHRARVVEAEQVVRIVDQHVEILQEVLAEDAANGKARGLEIAQFVHKHVLVDDGMGTGFEQVNLRVGNRCLKSHACDPGSSVNIQMKFRGQGGVDFRRLRAGVQEKVVGACVIDGDGQNYLVVVDEAEG